MWEFVYADGHVEGAALNGGPAQKKLHRDSKIAAMDQPPRDSRGNRCAGGLGIDQVDAIENHESMSHHKGQQFFLAWAQSDPKLAWEDVLDRRLFVDSAFPEMTDRSLLTMCM